MERESHTSTDPHETKGYESTDDDTAVSRRSAMAGLGGLVGAAIAPTGSVSASDVEGVDVDIHTRQTYRSIVDAIIPRTPELGGVQEPGALDIGLEDFVIYQMEFGQTVPPAWRRPDELDEEWELHYPSSVNGLERLVQGIEENAGFDIEQDLGIPREAVFGALEGIRLDITTTGSIILSTTVDGESNIERRDQLPVATLYAAALNLYALFLILGGGAQGEIRPREKFRGGGLFTWLSPTDRIQCVLFVSSDDGQAIEIAGDAFLPGPLLAKKLVSSVLVSTNLGYYTEWSGYGSTRTDDPNDRELELDYDQIQGWQQIGYGGPRPGRSGFVDGPYDEFAENDWGES